MVVRYGDVRSPRGLPTYDLGPTTVVMYRSATALPIGVCRNLSRQIAAAEAVQLVGARSMPDLIIAASKTFTQFQEDTGVFHGAYGVRIGDQLIHAVNKIKSDRDTRQAGIILWDPWRDNQPGKKDY